MTIFKTLIKPKVTKSHTKSITLTVDQLKVLIAERFGDHHEGAELTCSWNKRSLEAVTLKIDIGERND